ncbi:amidohydrolase [Tenacibaculum aestuariivivum]|uniref:amidohydrolase n=1 Tax=Tenacibaculum aestuariivivum TaxID=2006131 RepID=UPI003AB589F8
MNINNTLKTALIQSNLVWENPTQNRSNFQQKIENLPDNIDIIILPEMFTTGFTMEANYLAEKMDGITVVWLQKLAAKKNSAITGSIIINENNNYYNRLLFVHPCGKIDFYDKKHLFTLAGEHKVFSPGNKNALINFKGWKIRALICYDLRFPIWARNTENYDLLLYIASWPKSRIEAWNILLKARAIENMSYTIGVNRVGTDAYGYKYNGKSIVYNTLGTCISKKSTKGETCIIIELNKEKQNNIRSKFGFLNDKDAFNFK